MKIAWIIAVKDIREAFQNKGIYFYILLLLLLAFPYFDGLRNILDKIEPGNPAALRDTARQFLGNLMYTLPFTLSMLFCTYLAAYAVVLEKAKRTLESLLATPAGLRQVWIGKSLAVALPGIIVTYLVMALAIIVLNYAVVVPRVGEIIFPGSVPVLVSFIAIPLVVFLVVCNVSILQLIMTSPRLANSVFMIVFLGFYFMTVTGFSASWDFGLIYLVLLVVLVGITVIMTRFLTRERVVLSSKG